MIIPEPKEINVKLTSEEVENIIRELENCPQNMFSFLNYQNIVDKLKRSLEE